jgi:hypothetical protein
MCGSGEHEVTLSQHEVAEVRATGRTPEAVTDEIQQMLTDRQKDGWELTHVQPIIYNSSTTGYLLLFFGRP